MHLNAGLDIHQGKCVVFEILVRNKAGWVESCGSSFGINIYCFNRLRGGTDEFFYNRYWLDSYTRDFFSYDTSFSFPHDKRFSAR